MDSNSLTFLSAILRATSSNNEGTFSSFGGNEVNGGAFSREILENVDSICLRRFLLSEW